MVFVRIVILFLLTVWCFGMGTIPVNQINAFGAFMASLFFLVAPALYMLPTYEGWIRKQPNLTAIALVNILLGWTLVGWVVALVWGVRKPEPVIAHQAPPVVDPMSAAATGDQPSPTAPKATKTCPFCAEEILVAAIKCKHCGSDLAASA